MSVRSGLGRVMGVFLLLAASMICGCSGLGRSVYQQPELDLPPYWNAQETTGSAVANGELWNAQETTGSAVANGEQWWQGFQDPVLDQLIDRALRSNNDLAAATIKVRRARLQSGLTDTNLTPSVSVGADASLSRALKSGPSQRTHGVSAGLSYEIDLWGKLAAARDAASFEAQATEFDRQGTALSLIGTTASAYWQLGYLNQLIWYSEASIAYAQKTLTLVEAKHRAGAVSALDLAQARQALAGQRAEATQLAQQRVQARNALAILLDQAPQGAVPEPRSLPDGALPEVEAGLPASLLGRRPDLRAAELRLRESLADLDGSRASYYPSFTLTGSLGGSSTTLLDVLQNPVATLGAGLALPFVQWNVKTLSLKISETQYQEAVVGFRQRLYTALSEVENALSARAQYAAQGEELEEAVAQAKSAERLLELRYRAGSSAVQLWLDAQESRRNAEQALAENRLNRYRNAMTLYQSLGGPM